MKCPQISRKEEHPDPERMTTQSWSAPLCSLLVCSSQKTETSPLSTPGPALFGLGDSGAGIAAG